MITGSVLVRHSTKKIDDRQLVIVAGVLALPPGAEVTAEQVYTVTGRAEDGRVILELSGPHAPAEDIAGMRIDQVLTSKIWRI